MNATLQTVIALAAVVLAVAWLGWRAFARRGHPGCGSGCACPTDPLKAQLQPKPAPISVSRS